MKVHRRAQILCLIALLVSSPNIGEAVGRTYVRGYVRRDGTYVPPHYRTTPDGNFYNNWSTLGNVNPYTGKLGTKTTPEYGSGLHLHASTVAGFRLAPVPLSLQASPTKSLPLIDPGEHRQTIPDDIAKEIEAVAMEQWPNDYSMQAYTLKNQREGYLKLTQLLQLGRGLGVPQEIQHWALANAQHDWARDYSMQAYSYENNVEGYLKLSALLSSDEWKSLPESHSDWMMRMAYQDWSNDFSMQAYTLEKQLDGYHGLAKLEDDLARLPNGIAEDTLRRARSDWPNDLSMQAYVVQKEIEGYLEVTKARK